VERTLLSAAFDFGFAFAFDVDLAFDLGGWSSPFQACANSPVK
jgi:hypothetical protein